MPLVNLLSPYIATAIKWLSIVGGVLLILFQVRKSGKDAEKTEHLQSEVEHVRIANEARQRVDAAGDAERERLRKKWTRPKR